MVETRTSTPALHAGLHLPQGRPHIGARHLGRGVERTGEWQAGGEEGGEGAGGFEDIA
ncbi:MAG: hypothetical protein IPI38_19095 [Gemmatimonadetes bacterium]|nr:hypothetical protein [Gemmatimonadota bacterium]MBK6782274.1 hypothetical protein [Gemmatimonadota bacterium]MBK7352000.1 hypothetical protein [Gemmatimonadota bacterium]MBK7717480.1 hypothetical protein [Gemmatimonadota bacterium]MBK7784963.1 hypothetical protein [Gemmatimonadota bacterium]